MPSVYPCCASAADGPICATKPYSTMDALEDIHLLRTMGMDIVQQDLIVNPWHLGDEYKEHVGAWAQYLWKLEVGNPDFTLDLNSPDSAEFIALLKHAQEDFAEFGADAALERLGARWPVTNPARGGDDAIIVMPREHGILESTGEIGIFDRTGFSPLEPRIRLTPEQMGGRPDDSHLIERIIWALRLHRDVVGPLVDEHEDSNTESLNLFGDMSMDDMHEAMRDFIKDTTGEDVDPAEFMAQMRAAGGIHGPTHYDWHDVLESIGWDLEDWEEDPERYEAAFFANSPNEDRLTPVVCENYAFLPDDASDTLAREAMQAVASRYQKGAILLFKGMPYQEVDGLPYGFGGMLWWEKKWHPFALNADMKSPADLIEQINSGFEFGKPAPKYADKHHSVIATISVLAQNADPEDKPELAGFQTGKWITLMPK